MSRPPLQFLQGFVLAARMGNMSRAAEAMNVTVSALSHQMRQLEQRLGLGRVRLRGVRFGNLNTPQDLAAARIALP